MSMQRCNHSMMYGGYLLLSLSDLISVQDGAVRPGQDHKPLDLLVSVNEWMNKWVNECVNECVSVKKVHGPGSSRGLGLVLY